jgi:hypothetical protein
VLQAPGPNPVTPLRVAQVHQEGRLMTCKEIEGAASLTAPQTKRELDSGRASPTPGPLPASAIQFHLFPIDTRVPRSLDEIGRARLPRGPGPAHDFASHEAEGGRWALPPLLVSRHGEPRKREPGRFRTRRNRNAHEEGPASRPQPRSCRGIQAHLFRSALKSICLECDRAKARPYYERTRQARKGSA